MTTPPLTLHEVLDLREPHGLAGTALVRVRAHHAARDLLERVGANEVLALQVDAEFPGPMRTAIPNADIY